MANIRYRVPYELRVLAGDLATGRNLTNIFYLKSTVQLVSPPAYGDPIAGGGSTTTLLAALKTDYELGPLSMLSSKYKLQGYELRSMLGWQYDGSLFPIVGVSFGNPTLIQVFGTGGLVDGDLVFLQGITGAVAANGLWPVTVLSDKFFTVPADTTATPWTGGGQWQAVQGGKRWIYGDVETLGSSAVGGIVQESVALFATASVRRRGQTPGKSFQGRNSYSPIPETTVEMGTFTTSGKSGWATALNQWYGPFLNGGSEVPGSGQSYHYNVSKQIAFSQVTPFAESAAWSSLVLDMTLQPNMGSMLRRKPRLTSVITP